MPKNNLTLIHERFNNAAYYVDKDIIIDRNSLDDIYYIPDSIYDILIERFAWEETKHPRGQPKNKGQFARGSGGTSSAGSASQSTRQPRLTQRPSQRPQVSPSHAKALGTLKQFRNSGERVDLDTGRSVFGGVIDKIGVRANGQVGVQLQGSEEWVFPLQYKAKSTAGWQSTEEKEEKTSPAEHQEQINQLVSKGDLPTYSDPDIKKVESKQTNQTGLKDFDKKFQFDESIDQESKEAFTNAVNQIAKVHPDAFRNLKTKITSNPDFIQDPNIRKQVAAAKGAYVAGHNTIYINPKVNHKEFIALHELGHLFEYTEIPGRKLELNGAPGSRNWDGDQTPEGLKKIIFSIKRSRSFGRINLANQKAERDEPIELSNGEYFNVAPKYTKYISSNNELFARAFSQYIVHKTNQYKDQMERFHKSDGLNALQWSDEDFRPIAASIESFMNRYKND